jgi:hypothetical protein
MPGLLGDFLSWIDSQKRIGGDNLLQLATDPVERVKRAGYQAADQMRPFVDAAASGDVAGTATGLLSGGAMPTMAGVMTYHGTPHKFDKFDLSKIGTGEGAQSYGHGIYFAENPKVAKTYQDTLGKTEITVDGKSITPSSFPIGDPQRGAAQWVDYAKFSGSDNPIVDALSYARSGRAYPGINQELGYLKLWAEKQAKVSKGAFYKQDLPDEVLPSLLQWDKPVSKELSSSPMTGEEFWNSLVATFGPEKAAAELKKIGIPGLSYFDAVSRTGGKGTKNHVIWDQGLLDRMKPSLME